MRSQFIVSVVLLLLNCVDGQTDKCPIDIMLLLDNTQSMAPYKNKDETKRLNMIRQTTQLMIGSNVALATFQDKPIEPHGDKRDECFVSRLRLTEGWYGFYQQLIQLEGPKGGGTDDKQAQYQAIISAAMDPNVGWRPLAPAGQIPKNGETAARFIVLTTNSNPNVNGTLPDLPASTGGTDEPKVECDEQDYPSFEQVKNVLKNTNTQVLTDIPNHTYQLNWAEINKRLGQPPTYVAYQSDRLAIHPGLKYWYNTVCADLMRPAVGIQMADVPQNLKLNVDAKGKAQ